MRSSFITGLQFQKGIANLLNWRWRGSQGRCCQQDFRCKFRQKASYDSWSWFRLQQRTVASKHEESFSVLAAYRCFLLEIHQSSRTPSNPDLKFENSKSVKTEKSLETLIWFLQVSAHTHVQLSLCSVKFPFIYFIAKSVIWSEECGVLKLEQLAAEQCRTPHRNKKIPHWKWSQRSEVLYLRGHLCCGFIQRCTAMCKRLVTNTSLLTSA